MARGRRGTARSDLQAGLGRHAKAANFSTAAPVFPPGVGRFKIATVPVQELKQSPTPRRWSRRRAMLLAVGGAIALALLFQFLIMPWLVRARVAAALRDAGFRNAEFTVTRATLWGAELTDVQFAGGGAARVEIDYNPLDLWHGRIDTLRVTSLRHVIESPASATTKQRQPFGSQIDLPIRKIELSDSNIVLADDRLVQIPLQASLEKQGTRYAASATAGEAAALSVHASVSQTMRDGRVSAIIQGLSSDLLMRIVHVLAGDAEVNVNG
jgi:hypothetical protein